MTDTWPEPPPPNDGNGASDVWAWDSNTEPQAGRSKKKRKQDPWPWEDHPKSRCLDSDGFPESKPQRKSHQPQTANRGVHLSFGADSLEVGFAKTNNRNGKPLDKFEARGCDPQMVEQRLAQGRCTCTSYTGACHGSMGFKTLLACAVAFWALTYSERGHLLRTLYFAAKPRKQEEEEEEEEEESSGSSSDLETEQRHSPRQWSLCGKRVCVTNFCHLLGTSTATLRKHISGKPDRRSMARQPAIHEKAQCVDFFFYELYHSAAEPLPEKDPSAHNKEKRKVKTSMKSEEADIWHDDQPWLRQGDDEWALPGPKHVPDWNPDAPSVTTLSAFTVAAAAIVVGLPARYLQHTHIHDLYWLFEASWDCLRGRSPDVQMSVCPSYSLFKRRWQIWKKYLRIRKASSHAQCQTCWELQQKMNSNMLPWMVRGQAAKDLRVHYQHQYLDRCIYWSLRWASRCLGSVLCIIIDSMDKTKMAWPRWPCERLPKSMAGLVRPRFILTASIAHGWATLFFAQDEVHNHGSAAFCEVVCRTIEHVFQMSRRQGRQFPSHLVIQADNTVAQAKNQHAFIFLAWLVTKYKFITVNILFLMVGHTHEDVDQLFGVVLKLVLQRFRFQTPEEFLKLLHQELVNRVAAKGEELVTDVLLGIRDYAAWLAPMGCGLMNAFGTRAGVEAPHAFSFKFRRDLTHADVRDVEIPGVLQPGHPNDVMCCVKTYMRSAKLSHLPTLVIPNGRDLRVTTPEPLDVKKSYELSDDKVECYLTLAKMCEEDLEMPQAAQRLRDMVLIRKYVVPQAPWLRNPEVARLGQLELGEPIFPHLPAVSWRLVSRFTH